MKTDTSDIKFLFDNIISELKDSLIKLAQKEYLLQSSNDQDAQNIRMSEIELQMNNYTKDFKSYMKNISEIHEIIFDRTPFSKKMTIALEIEEKEKDLALERMKNGVTTFRGQTRDIVAEIIGMGSGKQYDKAKCVFLNADQAIFEKIDDKSLSIHKAYMNLTQKLNDSNDLK